jgi:hypothetical protein
MTFAVPGVFSAWVYLRFYQQRPNGSQGDTTEAFAFSTFFPVQLRPLINKLTHPCYRVLCPGHGASAAQSAFVINSGPLPGSDDAEAQRRRYVFSPSSHKAFLQRSTPQKT